MYLTLYVVIMTAYLHTLFTMAGRAIEIEEITNAEMSKPIEQKLSNITKGNQDV